MARSARHESFDETPMITLDPQALDFPAAAESLRPARVLRRRDLTSLGCLTHHRGRSVPAAGGVLLFGRDRLACFPDAWMQAGSFAGGDRSQILDQLVLDGPLPDWVEASIRFIDWHSARAAIIDGPRRRDVPARPVDVDDRHLLDTLADGRGGPPRNLPRRWAGRRGQPAADWPSSWRGACWWRSEAARTIVRSSPWHLGCSAGNDC